MTVSAIAINDMANLDLQRRLLELESENIEIKKELERLKRFAGKTGGGGILEEPCHFLIRKNGSNYEAVHGSGSDNAGKIYKTDAMAHTLINYVLANGLTVGRTNVERVVLKGNFELTGKIELPTDHVELDFSQAILKQPDGNNLADYMIEASGGFTNSRLIGGILDINGGNGNGNTQGINLLGQEFSRVEQIQIYNVDTPPSLNLISDRSFFRNIWIRDSTVDGIICSGAHNIFDYVYYYSTRPPLTGTIFSNGDGFNVVQNSMFVGASYEPDIGMDVLGSGHWVTNNYFDGTATAIRLSGAGTIRNRIEFNHMETHTNVILEASGATQNRFIGNTMYAATNYITFTGPLSFAKYNANYNPVGVIATPFRNTAMSYGIGPLGTAATPTASRDYVIQNVDIIISSTNSGNNNNAIIIKDPGGNQINLAALSTLDCLHLPIGYKINWGAFTGTAPTVTACGN